MSNSLYLTTMSQHHAMSICTWEYEHPYDIYNWPDWTIMHENEQEFANSDIRQNQYRALIIQKELVGFVQLFPLQHTIRLALFIAPHYCNQGFGSLALALAIKEIHTYHPEYEIDLEVETWNKRAISCYLNNGFNITDHYQYTQRGVMKDIYCMVYCPDE